MMNATFEVLKRKSLFKIIVYVLIASFSVYSSGCVTTTTESYKKERVQYAFQDEDYEIIMIVKNNSESINVRGFEAKYFKDYKGQKDVIVYTEKDTIREVKDERNTMRIKETVKTIPVADILEVYVEKTEIQVATTIVLCIGIIAFIAVVVIAIAMAAKSSCPFFYSYDGSKYVFDAESFGGAITEGLKRTDFSRMEYLKESEGYYKIMIRNEADETQHLDEMKLYALDHPVNTEVVPDYEGRYTAFRESMPPLKVTNEKGTDITGFFKKRDGIYWQSQMETDSSIFSSDLRHKLTFSFKKPPEAVKAKLLVNAGSTLWGSYMFKEMLSQHGEKVDDWYKVMDRQGIELQMLKTWQEGEELYDMKLYLKEGDTFVRNTWITSGGPFTIEDRMIDLDLSNIEGDDITLQINPPKGFWKIDYLGIVYDYNEDYDLKEMPLVSAEDNTGRNLKNILSENDRNYYVMPDNNDTAYVKFACIPLKEGMERTLYMKTSGFYEIHLPKSGPYNAEFFSNILIPGYIIKYSLGKYFERYSGNFTKN